MFTANTGRGLLVMPDVYDATAVAVRQSDITVLLDTPGNMSLPCAGMNYLASNLRRLRMAKGLSQQKLMETSGFTSVKEIERGKIQSPMYPTLEGLAQALDVTVADLFAEPRPVKAPRRRSSSSRRSAR